MADQQANPYTAPATVIYMSSDPKTGPRLSRTGRVVE
jgi:hypothetical protein